MQLRVLCIGLDKEGDTAGFLGVMLKRDTDNGFLYMKQTGVVQHVIEELGLVKSHDSWKIYAC